MTTPAFYVRLAMTVCLLGAPAQAGDLERGEALFKKCAICHAIEEGKRGIGPHLAEIVGRPVGAVEGYRYSTGMQDFADETPVWDLAALDGFIQNPRDHVKGTKMSFGGLRDATDRADLLAYLETLE